MGRAIHASIVSPILHIQENKSILYKMKILFLIYHGFSEHSGISKKIHYQIKGLKENGHEVHVCTYSINEQGHRIRYIDNHVLEDFGNGQWASLRKRFCYQSVVQYAIAEQIDFVYARSFHNANPFTIHLFHSLKKAGIKSVVEIPTYPYDQEYVGFPRKEKLELKIDQLFRRQLAKQTDRIVTFTDDSFIFGQKTIRISNGIDFDFIPLKQQTNHTPKELHLIGVAEVHYWHGFDRLIHGLGEYNSHPHTTVVYFHIIGGIGPSEMYNSQHAPGFHELIKKYQIEPYVLFHGQQFGKDLDRFFNQCDFAIGSLARHRSGISTIKPLKNREYAARGIPFIFSENDEDFNDKPYTMKAPADETPINIQEIIDFLKRTKILPSEIRNSIQHLSWKEQMKKVIEEVYD